MIVDAVVAGLAENPAATEDQLLRLLRERPEVAALGLGRRAAMTPPIQEAMAGHPLRSVRSMLAGHVA